MTVNTLAQPNKRTASAMGKYLLALVIFALILPLPDLAVGLFAALVVFYFVARSQALRQLHSSPLTFTLLVLTICYALGFAFGARNELALSSVGAFVAGMLLLFFVLSRARETKSFVTCCTILLVVGIALVSLSPFTVQSDTSKSFDLPFIAAFAPRLPKTINSNVLSGALVAILPLALGAVVQSVSTRTRIIGAIALPIIALDLILLQSRSAWLAFGVACVAMLVLWKKWFLPIAFMGLAAFLALAPQLNLPALNAPAGPFNIVGRLDQREEAWTLAVQLIREHPLLGIGPGTFQDYSAAAVKEIEPGVFETPLPHAHDFLLQVTVDAGIPGLLAFLALLFLTARSLWRAQQSVILRPLCAGLAGAWIAILVHGLTDATLWDTRASFVLWWILGLSLVWEYGIG